MSWRGCTFIAVAWALLQACTRAAAWFVCSLLSLDEADAMKVRNRQPQYGARSEAMYLHFSQCFAVSLRNAGREATWSHCKDAFLTMRSAAF